MSQNDPDEINRLIGTFVDLQEQWESDRESFDWSALQALAQKGAHAYNECAGPSFHALALDGIWHGEFHERFLAYSLQAGFEPFKVCRPGSAGGEIPVIDHASLADAALSNPSSARMRAALMEVARKRLEPMLSQLQSVQPGPHSGLWRMIEACAESIPRDLLEQFAPDLAREHHGDARVQSVDPIEGYLSTAEELVERHSKPYG